jgi:hypothetical protein
MELQVALVNVGLVALLAFAVEILVGHRTLQTKDPGS